MHPLEKLSAFVFLVSSMMAMGLTLAPHAIVAPLRNTRLVLLALGMNFVLAPVFAWLLVRLVSLERGHAAGLLLLGGAAGAPFLPKLVEIARGDLARAATLTVLLTLGTILFMPFALPLLIPELHADPWSIARPLVLLILLPFVTGMLLKRRNTLFAARAAPLLAKIANVSLLLLFILLIVLNRRALLAVIGTGAILAATLYILGLVFVTRLVPGSDAPTRDLLALATSARNFGAALVPAASSFRDPQVTTMLIVSAIVCLVVTFLTARWMRPKI